MIPLLLAPQKEKDTSGLTDVPSSASGKVLEVEYAYTEDRKLRGQLKDPNYIEAQVAPVCRMHVMQNTRILCMCDAFVMPAATAAADPTLVSAAFTHRSLTML